jgi:hypothetical protein
MKFLFLIVKIATLPMWLPLWLLWKCRAILGFALLAALIDGCASTSARLERSPCACNFTPLNTLHVEEGRHHA